MATITKIDLSGATDGGPILIAGTGTGDADVVHASGAGTTNWDEIWIWLVCNHSARVEIEIEWANATANQNIVQTIPFDGGAILVIPGWPLQNAKDVQIFAGTTNVVAAFGYVNRITA